MMDYISNSFLMPFISLLTSILIGWVIGPDWIVGEVEKTVSALQGRSYIVYDQIRRPGCDADPFLTSTGL